MFRNMVTSLFKYDRIRTTDVKAKELKRWADKIVTLAKQGDLNARRQALAIVREKDVVHKLFEEASERFGSISGGYTRVVKVGRRPGDAAPISIVELVAPEKSKKKDVTRKKSKAPVKKKAGAKKPAKAKKEEKAASAPEKSGADPVAEKAADADS